MTLDWKTPPPLFPFSSVFLSLSLTPSPFVVLGSHTLFFFVIHTEMDRSPLPHPFFHERHNCIKTDNDEEGGERRTTFKHKRKDRKETWAQFWICVKMAPFPCFPPPFPTCFHFLPTQLGYSRMLQEHMTYPDPPPFLFRLHSLSPGCRSASETFTSRYLVPCQCSFFSTRRSSLHAWLLNTLTCFNVNSVLWLWWLFLLKQWKNC